MFFESGVKVGCVAYTAPVGRIWLTTVGFVTLRTYNELMLAWPAIMAIQLPSGLTTNWSLPEASVTGTVPPGSGMACVVGVAVWTNDRLVVAALVVSSVR